MRDSACAEHEKRQLFSVREIHVAVPSDGYAEWLGVSTTSRPLTHYQLLGLNDFEADPAKIAVAADMSLARVRRCQPGNRIAEWQKILDELSTAKLVLCNGARKGQYDGQLRSRLGTRPAGRPAQYAAPPGDPSAAPARARTSAPSMRLLRGRRET